MQPLSTLFSSPIFWSIAAAFTISQLTKALLLVFKQGEKFKLEDFYRTGNMPSSHSAVVAAVVAILYLTEGFTPLFFVAFLFAAIVMRDAVGVRRTVGEESKVLTKLISTLKKKFHVNISRKMHQAMGHQPVEVLVGALIGIAAGILVYLFMF